MENIKSQIELNKNILTSEEYKDWLQKKLDRHGIDRTRLIAVVIVVERSLSFELMRTGSLRSKPYYKLFNEDGTKTRAWVHAAELALFLKYNGYKALPYVRAVIQHPMVRRFVANKERKKQIPLNVLFPSARKDTDRLKEYSKHFKAWHVKH